jgi:lysophospholipase L1-like esterase
MANHDRRETPARRARRGPSVVALGDSITLGIGDGLTPGIGAGWAAHVAHAIGASAFTNLAANGTRARTIGTSQVPTGLMQRPDLVLLTVGGNDVLRGDFSPSEITENVSDVIARLSRPGRQIVMISLDRIAAFDVLGQRVSTVMARRIGQANGALGMAVAGTEVHWINGAEVFARLGPSAWHIDRIHPSPAGHRALAEAALVRLAGTYTQVAAIEPPGASPSLASRAWWLARQGLPWIAKRSRDLIPQVAQVVTHELLEERRAKMRTRATIAA